MASVSTVAIIEAFQKNINLDLDYGLAEMKKIFSDSYKAVKLAQTPMKVKKEKLDANGDIKQKKPRTKRERDADGNIIKLRAPSAYNLFVADKIQQLHITNPDVDNKEIFKMAIALWHEAKNENVVVSNTDETDEMEENEIKKEDFSEITQEIETKDEIQQDDDDNEPELLIKKPSKKGRKPKVSMVVEEDSD